MPSLLPLVTGSAIAFFASKKPKSKRLIAAQKGILIKDGRSLELLQTVDTVVFDKTGTLTLDQPHVSAIHACDGL